MMTGNKSGEKMKSKTHCFTIKSAETRGLLCCCASLSHFKRQHFCYHIYPRRCGHVHIIKLLRPLTSTRPPPLSPLIALPPSSPEIIRVLQMKSQSHKSGTFPPPPHRFFHPLCCSLPLLSPHIYVLVCPADEKKTKRKRDRKDMDRRERGTNEMGGGLSNPGFPPANVSSWPMLSIKLTSVSQTFLCVFVCACVRVCCNPTWLRCSWPSLCCWSGCVGTTQGGEIQKTNLFQQSNFDVLWKSYIEIILRNKRECVTQRN